MKIAIYAGSFDPFTKGHEDVLLQAIDVFDKVIVLVCNNANKKHLLSNDIRVDLIKKYISKKDIHNVEIVDALIDEATVDFAKEKNAKYLIRGLRSVSDFEYEMQIASMNKILDNEVKTVYFTPSVENQFTSSSMVREFLRLNKSISKLVPKEIAKTVNKYYIETKYKDYI